jgi:uncharacterized protein (TIGR02466 family)
MNKIQLSNLFAYTFECGDSLTERVLGLVKQSKFEKNVSNLTTISHTFFDEELFIWFESCIKKVSDEIKIPNRISIPIIACWANTTKKLQKHHNHTHPNSFLSGIFYLSDHDKGNKTQFYLENPYMKNFEWLMIDSADQADAPSKLLKVEITPKKNTLVIFPSYVPHSVETNVETDLRYSIAFNTFFSGVINDNNRKSNFSIYPKTVREIINET